MKYIRQLLFKCKNRGDLDILYLGIQNLTQIEHVWKSTVMGCVNQDKYDYIDDNYDCSVLLYFSEYSDIEKYCVHPLHTNFVDAMLRKVEITVIDYSVDE